MNAVKKKHHIRTYITALSLLAAMPAVYGTESEIAYHDTNINFAPTYKMVLTYNSLAQDSQGNVLLLGTAQGVGIDFDPGPGVDHKGTLYGSTLFISKQNFDGSYGGTRLVTGNAVDANAYIRSVYDRLYPGRYYVPYAFSTDGNYRGVSIQVDANDNLYILGSNLSSTSNDGAMTNLVNTSVNELEKGNLFISQTYSTTPAAVDLDPLDGATAAPLFVIKINSQGNQVWSRVLGVTTASLSKEPFAVKSDGEAYIAGNFIGAVDFDPTTENDTRTSTSQAFSDAFITRLDTNGNYIDTRTSGKFYDPTVGTDGSSLYLSGNIRSATDFDPSNVFSINFSASTNGAFLTKFDANNAPVWTNSLFAESIASTSTGELYVANRISLTKVDRNGGTLWTRAFDANVSGLAVDKVGSAFVTGSFDGSVAIDFDPSSGVDIPLNNGGMDIFITAFDSNGNYSETKSIGGPAMDVGGKLMVVDNTLYTSGTFGYHRFDLPWQSFVPGGAVPVDFNPGAGYDYQTPSPNGNPTAFLSKYDISASSTITVTARGTPVNGVYPTMIVRIDGQVVGTFNVTATYAPYTVAVNAAPDVSHLIDVVFTNDAGRRTPEGVKIEDRNLYIQSLRVNTTTLAPNSTGVTYDRGWGNAAFDGISVIAGQGGMWWNGALRFTVPATAF